MITVDRSQFEPQPPQSVVVTGVDMDFMPLVILVFKIALASALVSLVISVPLFFILSALNSLQHTFTR